jgi:hypothetical protein
MASWWEKETQNSRTAVTNQAYDIIKLDTRVWTIKLIWYSLILLQDRTTMEISTLVIYLFINARMPLTYVTTQSHSSVRGLINKWIVLYLHKEQAWKTEIIESSITTQYSSIISFKHITETACQISEWTKQTKLHFPWICIA